MFAGFCRFSDAIQTGRVQFQQFCESRMLGCLNPPTNFDRCFEVPGRSSKIRVAVDQVFDPQGSINRTGERRHDHDREYDRDDDKE